MKKLFAAALIVLSATVLTGCSLFSQSEPIDSTPLVEPVVDPQGWTRDVTVDDFTEAFPDLDTDELIPLTNEIVQNNTRAWMLGNGEGHYLDALDWAGQYAELEESEYADGSFSGTYTNDERSILFIVTRIGEDDDDDKDSGFFIYVTSSI